MREICRNWNCKNEYATPIEGIPYYSSSGIIYANDRRGKKFAVCTIRHERFDDQNFQFVFSPMWKVIDALPPSVFQGIPGLDLSLRLENYFRVNMTPVFISERTPGEGREDLWQLLENVGLDYYDRFEWLLRSDMRCGTDNLTVERERETSNTIRYEKNNIIQIKDAQPCDWIVIEDLEKAADFNKQFRANLIEVLRSGANIRLENEERVISNDEHSAMLRLLLIQEKLDEKYLKERQAEGIANAKNENRYRGRKKQEIDPVLLAEVAAAFKAKKLTVEDAMQRLKINSRSTFFRRLKEVK